MRTWFLALLAALLLPVAALATPDTPYDPVLMTYYPQLTPAQQTVFDLIYAAAWRGDAQVGLPEGTRYADAERAVQALMWDCPELCALGREYSFTYYMDAPEIALAVRLTYDRPAEVQSRMLARAAELAAQAEGDGWTKALYFHDLLCGMVAYDPAAPHPSDAAGALLDGRATCEGYARGMALLCRLAGIPAGVVRGDAWDGEYLQPHSWNVVCADGVWTNADVTWDDQPRVPQPLRWYFGLTDDQLHQTHFPAGGFAAPPCTETSANWFVRTGLMVDDVNESAIVAAAARQLAQDGCIQLCFANDMIYDAFMGKLGEFLASAVECGASNRCSYVCHDGLKCIVIMQD